MPPLRPVAVKLRFGDNSVGLDDGSIVRSAEQAVAAAASLAEAQGLQHALMGYLPGFATPRIVCDVPFVGKRWVHQVESYDRVLGISYWTKNYRTSIEATDPAALQRNYPYYDPISTLPAAGLEHWRAAVTELRHALHACRVEAQSCALKAVGEDPDVLHHVAPPNTPPRTSVRCNAPTSES